MASIEIYSTAYLHSDPVHLFRHLLFKTGFRHVNMETRGKNITLLYWSHQSWLAVVWVTSAPRAVAEICFH